MVGKSIPNSACGKHTCIPFWNFYYFIGSVKRRLTQSSRGADLFVVPKTIIPIQELLFSRSSVVHLLTCATLAPGPLKYYGKYFPSFSPVGGIIPSKLLRATLFYSLLKFLCANYGNTSHTLNQVSSKDNGNDGGNNNPHTVRNLKKGGQAVFVSTRNVKLKVNNSHKVNLPPKV